MGSADLADLADRATSTSDSRADRVAAPIGGNPAAPAATVGHAALAAGDGLAVALGRPSAAGPVRR